MKEKIEARIEELTQRIKRYETERDILNKLLIPEGECFKIADTPPLGGGIEFHDPLKELMTGEVHKQESLVLAPGDRVRCSRPHDRINEAGRVLNGAGDTILIRWDSGVMWTASVINANIQYIDRIDYK